MKRAAPAKADRWVCTWTKAGRRNQGGIIPYSVYYSQMPGQGHDSSWHALVLYLLQNSTRERTTLYRTDKTAPACTLSWSCRELEVPHSHGQREIPNLFPWVVKGGLGSTWAPGMNLSDAMAMSQLAEHLRWPMSQGDQWLAQDGYLLPVWEMWNGHPWPEAERFLHGEAGEAGFTCGDKGYQLWLLILLFLTSLSYGQERDQIMTCSWPPLLSVRQRVL